MALPDILKARGFAEDFEYGRRAAFTRTVVHDGDGRGDGPDELRRVGAVEAVVRGLVEVDVADQVVGADELLLVVPGEVAHVDEAELAVLENEADALVVVGVLFGAVGLETGAGGVRRAGAL